MSLSNLRKSTFRVLNLTSVVFRQGALRLQNSQTSQRSQIANMSAASEKPGADKVVEIVWDDKQNLFRTPDGKAYLSYTVRSSRNTKEKKQDVLDLQHTFVPSSFRGQGIAARLCVAAFEHAKEKQFLVQPTCSYVSDTFLPRNPEWNDLVANDGTRSGL